MDQEELKEAVEEASRKELDNWELFKEVAEGVETTGAEEVNELPILYRMEVKKILHKLDKTELAKKIKC
ncbi:MAG: hypothetical protein MUP58_00490 [Candidatus Nanohaloarchaeota archaeon QJJ-9]|nr:hypothetical protein [Candidatus Nanohaloarchaeota archaeon QJJ-9]